MPGKFHLKLYTGQPLRQRETFEQCWSLFADPLPAGERWGRSERTTEPFTSDPSAAFELFRRAETLFVKGKGDGFLGMLKWNDGRFFTVNVWLKPSALGRQSRRDRWLEWMFRLIETVPSLYGYGVSSEEYDAKHLQESKDSRKAVGVSLSELSEFLPGIYWLTVFGPELSEAFDFRRLEAMPGVAVRRLLGRQTVVQLDGEPIPADMDERLAVEAHIAQQLGAEYFFDRARGAGPRRAVPAFQAALERLTSTP